MSQRSGQEITPAVPNLCVWFYGILEQHSTACGGKGFKNDNHALVHMVAWNGSRSSLVFWGVPAQ